VHAEKHQARSRDDGENTAPDPDAFAFSLCRHKTPTPDVRCHLIRKPAEEGSTPLGAGHPGIMT
jgi:hypothetical protein